MSRPTSRRTAGSGTDGATRAGARRRGSGGIGCVSGRLALRLQKALSRPPLYRPSQRRSPPEPAFHHTAQQNRTDESQQRGTNRTNSVRKQVRLQSIWIRTRWIRLPLRHELKPLGKPLKPISDRFKYSEVREIPIYIFELLPFALLKPFDFRNPIRWH